MSKSRAAKYGDRNDRGGYRGGDRGGYRDRGDSRGGFRGGDRRYDDRGPRRDFGDRPKGCFNCGVEGHIARDCTERNRISNFQPKNPDNSIGTLNPDMIETTETIETEVTIEEADQDLETNIRNTEKEAPAQAEADLMSYFIFIYKQNILNFK